MSHIQGSWPKHHPRRRFGLVRFACHALVGDDPLILGGKQSLLAAHWLTSCTASFGLTRGRNWSRSWERSNRDTFVVERLHRLRGHALLLLHLLHLHVFLLLKPVMPICPLHFNFSCNCRVSLRYSRLINNALMLINQNV